ncbi:unnamed protein product [Prorocentrum cordatum]|uniref:Uncharacterized protein n=1 Tax=Prorocentrum cordatum TaxID=2364126 RepID=A0ABN9VQN1_9DINO|nr:unnamed protein product [Polarella glacialis]
MKEQSAFGDDIGESASQVGGDGGQGDQADVYIKKLNLEVAILKGKDGVAFHHAGLRVKSWTATHDKKEMGEKLSKHMKDYALAASLKPNPVERLTPDQLQKAYDRVKTSMTIPSAVQLDIWEQDALSRGSKVTFPVDVPHFLSHCWPWPIRCNVAKDLVHPDHVEFEPLEPRLMLVSGEFSTKIEKFRLHFIRNVLGEFMTKGSNGREFVQSTCKHLHEWADSTMEQCEDLGDTSAYLCEITTVANGIDTLFDMEKLLDGDAGENAMNDLRELSDTEHNSSVIKSVALVIANADYYRDMLTNALTNAAKINDARPKYVDINSELTTTMQLGPHELASGLEGTLKMLPTVIFAVPGHCVKRLNEKTMTVICQVIGIAKAECQNEGGQDVLQKALSVLKLAATCFPMETSIPKWKTELVELISKLQSSTTSKAIAEGFGGIENGNDAIAKLDKMETLLGGISLACLDEEKKQEIVNSLRFLCEGALSSYPAQDVDRIGRLIDDVVQSLGIDYETVEQKIAHALVAGRSLHQLVQNVNALIDPPAGQAQQDVDPASTATLQFLVQQLTSLSTEIQDVRNVGDFLAALEATRTDAVECLRSVGGAKLEEANRSAQDIIEKLRPLQGGLEGADHWLEGLVDNKRTKWPDFYEYAQKTIMQDKGTAGLKKELDAANAVLGRIAELEKAFCLDADGAVKQGLHEVVVKCTEVFYTGLFLHAFKKPKDKVALRATISKHKDAFKQIEGVSLGNLPKVLTDRCEQAMKFQISV